MEAGISKKVWEIENYSSSLVKSRVSLNTSPLLPPTSESELAILKMAIKERTVLLVDDTDDTRFMLKRMLELNGFQVIEATNGLMAVEMARAQCPGLILMDLNMPEMDGLEAVKQIRECKEACKDALILAMTAHDTYGMKEAALEAGCDEYIDKPNDLDYLEEVLLRYLDFR